MSMRAKVKLVTGYIPIPGHTRTAEEYGRLGDELKKITSAPVGAAYRPLQQCWLWGVLQHPSFKNASHSVGDNPRKNSMAYHIVQHEKFQILEQESEHEFSADTFVWIDYGICHQPGVTAAVIDDFTKKVRKGDLAIPGCWDKGRDPDKQFPSWRFCGSLIIVPRKLIAPLAAAMRMTTRARLSGQNRVTFEVTDLADVERNFPQIPIRWYPGDHNQSQFVNYR